MNTVSGLLHSSASNCVVTSMVWEQSCVGIHETLSVLFHFIGFWMLLVFFLAQQDYHEHLPSKPLAHSIPVWPELSKAWEYEPHEVCTRQNSLNEAKAKDWKLQKNDSVTSRMMNCLEWSNDLSANMAWACQDHDKWKESVHCRATSRNASHAWGCTLHKRFLGDSVNGSDSQHRFVFGTAMYDHNLRTRQNLQGIDLQRVRSQEPHRHCLPLSTWSIGTCLWNAKGLSNKTGGPNASSFLIAVQRRPTLRGAGCLWQFRHF